MAKLRKAGWIQGILNRRLRWSQDPLLLVCLLPLHLWAHPNNLMAQEKIVSPCDKLQGTLGWSGLDRISTPIIVFVTWKDLSALCQITTWDQPLWSIGWFGFPVRGTEHGTAWSGTPGQLQLLILFVTASFPIAGPNCVCVCEIKEEICLILFHVEEFPWWLGSGLG